MAKFEIFHDRKKQYRWRLLGRNGRIIAVAGEGFTRKENCKKSITTLTKSVTNHTIIDKTPVKKKKAA